MVIPRIRLFIAFTLFFTPIFAQDIAINEFLAKPVTGQIEFVELVNISGKSVDIGNWQISDSGSDKSLPSAIINPGDYIILADDSTLYPYVSAGVHYLIPLGGLPSLNNSGDDIKLSNSSNIVIDSLAYDNNWTIDYAYSTEKTLPSEESSVLDNWKLSKDTLGTPGSINSVTPLSIDGAINGDVSFSLARPDKYDNVVAIVPILNAGLNNISGTLTASVNGNNVGSKSIGTMLPEESKDHYLSISALPSGRHNVTSPQSLDHI